jgi:hypothetical protein
MKKLSIRHLDQQITGPFLERIVRFYRNHRSELNSVRDPIQLLTSMNRGSAFVVEDDFTGAIKGIGLCFFHSKAFFEIGGDRIIENGLGLQTIINDCRCINTMLFDPPREGIFSSILEGNIPSIKSYEKSGFSLWEGSDAMFYETGFERVVAEEKKIKFYLFKVSESLNQARRILDLLRNPIVRRSGNNAEVYIKLDFSLVRDPALRTVLERIASGDVLLPLHV